MEKIKFDNHTKFPPNFHNWLRTDNDKKQEIWANAHEMRESL